MPLSAAILAFALAANTAPADTNTAPHARAATSCVSAERTGTFRVTAQRPGGKDLRLGLIVLENIDGCLEATFITDGASPAAIDGLKVSDTTLRGGLRLTTGTATVSLQFAGSTVEGSIVQGQKEWTVAGRKTS